MERAISVSSVNLACCALESAAALQEWERDHRVGESVDLNVLVIAGTVTRANSKLVVQEYQRLAEPKKVIAFGVCTISGGPYWDSYAVLPGIGELIPVDVFVPGCPPRPEDLTAVLDQLAGSRV